MNTRTRGLACLAGLLGAAGVALAAAASHLDTGPGLMAAALLLAIHAAAVLAIAAVVEIRPGPGTMLLWPALALGLGAALFAGDLAARAFLGTRLFPSAAPTGGFVMIAGWLGIAVVAALARERG